MSKAGDAYTALTAALDLNPAECLNVDLFVQDELSKFEADQLADFCTDCKVARECFAYAAAARPLAGFWSGHRNSYYRTTKGLTDG